MGKQVFTHKMSVLDLEDITTQKVYRYSSDWIIDNIPGKNYADKEEKIRTFYQKNYGKTTAELIGEDTIKFIKKLVKEEIKNNGRQ